MRLRAGTAPSLPGRISVSVAAANYASYKFVRSDPGPLNVNAKLYQP
jgi:hypothetical protein